MTPEKLAKWYADFFQALMETGAFTEDQAMAIILRTVPRKIEEKTDPRELLKKYRGKK